jgi:hypothetical protein
MGMVSGLRTYRGKLWYLPMAGHKAQSSCAHMSGLTHSASHCAETGSKPADMFPETSYTPVHPSHSYHDSINLHYHPLQVSFLYVYIFGNWCLNLCSPVAEYSAVFFCL